MTADPDTPEYRLRAFCEELDVPYFSFGHGISQGDVNCDIRAVLEKLKQLEEGKQNV